jgi:hypothetical protein
MRLWLSSTILCNMRHPTPWPLSAPNHHFVPHDDLLFRIEYTYTFFITLPTYALRLVHHNASPSSMKSFPPALRLYLNSQISSKNPADRTAHRKPQDRDLAPILTRTTITHSVVQLTKMRLTKLTVLLAACCPALARVLWNFEIYEACKNSKGNYTLCHAAVNALPTIRLFIPYQKRQT